MKNTTPLAVAMTLLAAAGAHAQFDTVINLPGDPVFGDTIGGKGNDSIGNSNGDPAPTTQLNVADGGTILDKFRVFAGSEVNITGGDVGESLTVNAGSEVNISGGSLRDISVLGSQVDISGGDFKGDLTAFDGSVVTISAGIFFSGDLEVLAGGEVLVAGGSFVDSFLVFDGGKLTISGGSPGDLVAASAGSEVNLHGTAFFLDGVPLDQLIIGQAFVVNDRGATLSGNLADGSAFSFDLAPTNAGFDYFDPAATLSVTLVPEPTSLALLGLGGLIVCRRRRS